MSNEELIAVGGKIFNPLAGTRIGAKRLHGARIQPNSPPITRGCHLADFSGWSYATGDVVLGTNPVSSQPQSIAVLEAALEDIRRTFGVENLLPHSVLAHIDLQAEVENVNRTRPESGFRALRAAIRPTPFDITLEKMLAYASRRTGQYGFYSRPARAPTTNGSGQGTDMVIHESAANTALPGC